GRLLERELGGLAGAAVAFDRAHHPLHEREERHPQPDQRKEEQPREREHERTDRRGERRIRLIQLEDAERLRPATDLERHVDLERLDVLSRTTFVVELRYVADLVAAEDALELVD